MIGKIPKITTTNAAQKVRFSRHCWRSKVNLPTNYYYGNQHMAKDLRGDQDKHSLINWLMTVNYRRKIFEMWWMIDSIEKAKLWMCDCGRSNDDDVGGGGNRRWVLSYSCCCYCCFHLCFCFFFAHVLSLSTIAVVTVGSFTICFLCLWHNRHNTYPLSQYSYPNTLI